MQRCVLKLLLVKDGWTALHIAANKGFERIVKILLEHGANIHSQDDVLIFFFFLICFVILICCCSYLILVVVMERVGWLCVICFVLFLKLLFVKRGWTPLHWAACKCFADIVRTLLEHGSNIDFRDDVLIFFFLFFVFLFLIVIQLFQLRGRWLCVMSFF